MESNFDTYIMTAACNMNNCPYGYDISCRECVRRMVAEDDEKRITDTVEKTSELIRSFVKEWNMTNHKRISYIASDELISYLRNHMKEKRNAE